MSSNSSDFKHVTNTITNYIYGGSGTMKDLTNVENVNTLNTEKQPEKRRTSKRLKTKKSVPEEKDTLLKGFSKTVATVIKEKANEIYEGRSYQKLDNTAKNTISNGFNSILDLSDNNEDKNSQRSLFTSDQWDTLNKIWNKKKVWKPLPDDIQKCLKNIEGLAETDVKAAYEKTLQMQAKYAMNENESYFKVYSFLLDLLKKNMRILNMNCQELYTEQDYVVKVWSPIISAVFEDSIMFCKWGESVSTESSRAKKVNQEQSAVCIGDKVDARICTKTSDGKVIDLINFEFSNNLKNNKFHADHRKVLREAKTVADRFYKSPYMKKRSKKSIKAIAIEVARVEGQINDLRLVDHGLYISTKVGSLRLPTSGIDLRKARTLLERLYDIKDSAMALINHHAALENEQVAAVKSMDAKQKNNRSPYDENFDDYTGTEADDGYLEWNRGSWFPPSTKKDTVYDGTFPKYLFYPPPVE